MVVTRPARPQLMALILTIIPRIRAVVLVAISRLEEASLAIVVVLDQTRAPSPEAINLNSSIISNNTKVVILLKINKDDHLAHAPRPLDLEHQELVEARVAMKAKAISEFLHQVVVMEVDVLVANQAVAT